MITNIPEVKMGIITVSRACFDISLSQNRRMAITQIYGDIYECKIVVENELDAQKAVLDVKSKGVNALVVFLGNFGPETPETLIARFFDGPVMYVAAAEEDTRGLKSSRGDAYCGMLNCSYDLNLRGLNAYIPEYPVGTAADIADMIKGFVPIARAVLGVKNLKIITFGPRPDEFLACNGPLQALYDLGVEVQENSDLDLLTYYRKHDGDERIKKTAEEICEEMKPDAGMKPIVEKLAQYEITLLDWAENMKGSRQYVAFANRCWPNFAENFGFVPCYINGRMAAKGIPVSCEVDIYGAFSEYIGYCISGQPVTLLDINNSVPEDLYEKEIRGKYDYRLNETFMGFHCGNTAPCLLQKPVLSYQRIMQNGIDPVGEPDITRGTSEGDLVPGEITVFRLQGAAAGGTRAYIAEGEILPVPSHSFGSIGIIAISEMERFYRHVLIRDAYPHHTTVIWGHYGSELFDFLEYLQIPKISYNQPRDERYPTENPFRRKK